MYNLVHINNIYEMKPRRKNHSVHIRFINLHITYKKNKSFISANKNRVAEIIKRIYK